MAYPPSETGAWVQNFRYAKCHAFCGTKELA